MDNLPIRIRMSLRDEITNPDSTLSLKFKSVSETLGHKIVFDPEWPMIWDIFKQQYPDSAIFIPSISNIVVAWCDAFTSWLENAGNESSVDRLLDHLRRAGRLNLVLNASKEYTRIRTKFVDVKQRFEIVLPSSGKLLTKAIEPGFATDFLGLFSEDRDKDSGAAPLIDDPEWAEVSVRTPSTAGAQALKQDAEAMPDIKLIERPEELINRPPYRLIVRQSGRSCVVVQGHSPSLITLEAYLKKWSRIENYKVDRPPIVKVELAESPFGLGLLYDTLFLEINGNSAREMNATLVLAFVENVLGYTLVPTNGAIGSVWEFTRSRPFK